MQKKQLLSEDNLKKNYKIYIYIETAIDNYEQSVNLPSIANIKIKEEEFSDKYRSITENEKILHRSIENLK